MYGHLPIKDTSITWRIVATNDEVLSGNLTTDGNGEFEIYLQTDLLDNAPAAMTIGVKRSSGEVDHTYECDEVPCTERTIYIHPLTFETHVEFSDVSVVRITGTVTIATTEHNAFPAGCPLRGAKVCGYDHHRHTLLACVSTSPTGHYSLPIVNGLDFYVEVTYGQNHTFERLENERIRGPQGLFNGQTRTGEDMMYVYFHADAEDAVQLPIDFKDTTMSKARFEVAGGLCNRTLGRSMVELTIPTCADTWSKTVQLTSWFQSLDLPAHVMDAKLASTTAYQDDIGDTVTNYFTATNTRIQNLDLIDDDATLRWEYHPEPKYDVKLSASPSIPCDTIIVSSGRKTTITVTVREDYWDDQASCTHVPGNVTIRNELGEPEDDVMEMAEAGTITPAQATLLLACRERCTLPIEHRQSGPNVDGAHVMIPALIGQPDAVATIAGVQFAKLLEVGVLTSVYSPSTTYPVVVTGMQIISEDFTMVRERSLQRTALSCLTLVVVHRTFLNTSQ